MNLTDRKLLAEKFRLIAGNTSAIRALALDTIKQNPGDNELVDLVDRWRDAKGEASVIAICDEVKGMAEPSGKSATSSA